MTSEQYQQLLQELARVSGLADASALLTSGHLRVGDLNLQLHHEPRYDERLLQVRALLGKIPPQEHVTIAMALLEANYVGGYGGECVFSVLPDSQDVVLTIKIRLPAAVTAQDLWQSLSDIARYASRMWEQITSVAALAQHA